MLIHATGYKFNSFFVFLYLTTNLIYAKAGATCAFWPKPKNPRDRNVIF